MVIFWPQAIYPSGMVGWYGLGGVVPGFAGSGVAPIVTTYPVIAGHQPLALTVGLNL